MCECVQSFGDLQDLGLAILLVIGLLAISFGLAFLTSRITR